MDAIAAPERTTFRSILADREVRLVVGLALAFMFGMGLVFPILPLYVRSLGGSYDDVGLFVAAWAVARLVSDLAAGVVVDRVGVRTSAMCGLALMAAAMTATGLAPGYGFATGCYALAGVGSALTFAAMYSHLLGIVPKERIGRTFSVFYGAFNVGIIGGAFAGGLVADGLGVHVPFFFAAGVALLCGGLYLVLLPARGVAAPAGAPRGPRAALALLRVPGFAMVLVTQLAYLWMIAAVFDTLVPLYADSLGVAATGIGAIFAIALAVELAVLYPTGALTDRRGRRFVLMPALVLLAASTATLGLTGSPVVLGLAMAILGLGAGLAGVPPSAMLSDLTPAGSTGVAVGLFRFVGDLGFTLGPLAAGFAADGLGFPIAFALMAAPIAAAFAMVAAGRETLATARPS